MKAVLRQITSSPEQSFLVRKDVGESMVNNWHYHPEIELLYIKKSSGTWLIGDHIGHFENGDIVLIGPDLPHCFRHEKKYTGKKSTGSGETICIKFLPEVFGDHFFKMPELKAIKSLLHKSSGGLKLKEHTAIVVGAMVDKIMEVPPGKRVINLLSILDEIATERAYTFLSSKGFIQMPADNHTKRIKFIFEYSFNNYSEKITIAYLASRLNMTKESFCRYFKSKTGKTYIRFLMEVRIGHACRLLVDEKNVTEISYACGYNHISHFNHQFKTITGKQPLTYKRDYLVEE